MALMMIRSPGAAPTLDSIRARFGLTRAELDDEYGVIAVDSDCYTVRVDDRAAARLQSDSEWDVQGPFSDPRIDPVR